MVDKKKWSFVVKWLKNKYVLCTAVFLVFFFILDDNGLFTTYSLRQNNRMLKKQKMELEESILQDSLNCAKMTSNLEEIERFGRENYFMKRDNEEIFIVKRDK